MLGGLRLPVIVLFCRWCVVRVHSPASACDLVKLLLIEHLLLKFRFFLLHHIFFICYNGISAAKI